MSFHSPVITYLNVAVNIGSSSECPSSPSNLICLTTNACNVCGSEVSGAYQGCSVTSTTPVCDFDSTTSGIQSSATKKLAECVGCKKAGSYRLEYTVIDSMCNTFIHLISINEKHLG